MIPLTGGQTIIDECNEETGTRYFIEMIHERIGERDLFDDINQEITEMTVIMGELDVLLG
jgi:hypothetical protein